jgi:hypothetical protein
VVLLSGCTGSAGDEGLDGFRTPSPGTSRPAFVLPAGKADLTLAPGEVQSPDGFQPSLTVRLRGTWTSVHRDTDVFDLGQPDPKRDAPLVAVVVARGEDLTADALTPIGRAARRAGAMTKRGHLSLAGSRVPYLDVRNGSGQVFASASGTIALDTAPKQRLRAISVELAGRSLVALVLVPDATRWSSAWPDVRALLATMRAV